MEEVNYKSEKTTRCCDWIGSKALDTNQLILLLCNTAFLFSFTSNLE